MGTESTHRIVRRAELPAITLRVTNGSMDCYRTHTHLEYSVGLVDAGEAVFTHPDGPHRVGAATVVLIEPGVPHACNPLPGQPWSYRMLFIEAGWLHERLARYGTGIRPLAALRFRTRWLAAQPAATHIDGICRAMEDTHPQSSEHLSHRLCHWLHDLIEPQAPSDEPPVLPPELRPAWDVLLGEAGWQTSVQDLARHCGLHPTTFIRRFKAAVGFTPGEFLRDRQVNGARRLIASGAHLAEAAYAMGFADQAHMQRAFKARHAMTPGCFAKSAAPDT